MRALLARRGRFPHALLVAGPAGIGKAAFTHALAQGLLCESPREGLACGACPACNWFSQGNHPDFRQLLPAAVEEDEAPEAGDAARDGERKSVVIKVGQVRDVADFMALSTHRAGFRVLILRPAEALQPAAANALLKTLEEPPPATAILLVSDRPSRLLATIRSRCQVIALGMPPPEAALAWLLAEGVDGAEDALALAGGSPLLARDLAEAGSRAWRERAVAELARPDGAQALAFAAGVDRDRVEPLLFVMQTWLEDLLRAKQSAPPRRHRAHAAALRAKARRAPTEALLALDRELCQARRVASHPLNAQLFAEYLLMTYNRATVGTR